MHHLLYIDPGSGTFIIQAIAAAALSVVFFFKNIKNHIKAFFFRKKKKD